MTLEQEFNKRIAAIHGLGSQNAGRRNTGDDTMDIRHAEFQAMADVFLGENYDQAKLAQVEELQIALHEQQTALYQQCDNKELEPEEYVDSFNALLENTFAKCEEILGQQDFVKLFGARRSELGGFIDKDAFLRSHQSAQRPANAGYTK